MNLLEIDRYQASRSVPYVLEARAWIYRRKWRYVCELLIHAAPKEKGKRAGGVVSGQRKNKIKENEAIVVSIQVPGTVLNVHSSSTRKETFLSMPI